MGCDEGSSSVFRNIIVWETGAEGKKKRRNHPSNFKAKVEVAALNRNKSLAELAEQFDIHPNQIAEWMRQLVGNADQVLGKS